MISEIEKHDIVSRAEASFLGLAIGDALGAPVEFMTAGEITAKYGCLNEMVGGGWLRLKPGAVTDDTEMALEMARAFKEADGWTLEGIAQRFASWLKGNPADVGSTCRKGIRNFILHGMLEVPFNEWDAGNGAVMRVLPVALISLGDLIKTEEYAIRQAHLTHNHPLSDSGCITMSKLIQLAIMGHSKSQLRREVEDLCQKHPNFMFTNYKGMATGYVVDTLQTVFHHFFRTRSFEECVVATINQGGDADTTGAIAGMLAGAYYGQESLPKRWLRKMDQRLLDEITTLSSSLVTLSPRMHYTSTT
jgi:ADP-ribosyl-[dinitrogen reductase] hydrolase